LLFTVFRRATSRSSPTIVINLRGLPLLAVAHSLSRCITCQGVCIQQLHAAKRLPPWHRT